MNRIKSTIAVSAFSLLILGLPAIASAQWTGGGYGNGGYGNGGYGNNGYYGNANVRSVVKNLKNKAERFERAVDRYDGRYDNTNGRNGGWGNWGGWGNNNTYGQNLDNLADRFKEATDDLEDAFGRGRDLNNSADEARQVLNLAAAIDREINNSRGRRSNLFGQWNSMRQDLNVLANTYGYYNSGNGRGRNGRNNFPF